MFAIMIFIDKTQADCHYYLKRLVKESTIIHFVKFASLETHFNIAHKFMAMCCMLLVSF